MIDKPTRCVDPVIKYCQGCMWGYERYPEWVETVEDLSWCTIESGCTLGFDQGRPEDEPTAEELKEFEWWCNHTSGPVKRAYCPICDDEFELYSEDSADNCPFCGHHIVLREEY